MIKCKTHGATRNILSIVLVVSFAMTTLVACGSSTTTNQTPTTTTNQNSGISKIQHIIVIMQENRSFDSYFGTYPGADGIPMKDGVPTVCVNDPQTGQCVKPYHNPNDLNGGGPHGAPNATADINGGQMNGFIAQAEKGRKGCLNSTDPLCTNSKSIDVMGYHDAREIPNYWSYAQNFVLQDHMFEPNASWSLPAHLFMVSAWSAKCTDPMDPFSCTGALENPNPDGGFSGPNDGQLHYA